MRYYSKNSALAKQINNSIYLLVSVTSNTPWRYRLKEYRQFWRSRHTLSLVWQYSIYIFNIGSISVQLKSHLRSYRKWRHRKRPWLEMTSLEVTWPELEVTWPEVCSAQQAPAFFSYYSSSTKCTIAYDQHGYRMWRHQTSPDPEGGYLGRVGCAHA
jgi:hypothetical protein